MIPANEWWAVLQNYNLTVYPAQVVFYLLAIVALATFFTQPPAIANRVMKGFFVISFGWIGIVFFLLLGQQLPAHYVQAILFLSLAALFAADFLNQTSQFNVPRAGWRRAMTIAGLGLVMAYPLFSVLLGRPASQWIIPGTFPCPTTALALVLMATTFPAVRRWQYLVTWVQLSNCEHGCSDGI